MVKINRQELESLLAQMRRAEGYCRNAVSYSNCGPHDEATRSYAGASGYARATLAEVIQELETAL